MKLSKKIVAAVAMTTALAIGTSMFVSCSSGDDDDDVQKTEQTNKGDTSKGGNTEDEGEKENPGTGNGEDQAEEDNNED